jgi:hypothetical protein
VADGKKKRSLREAFGVVRPPEETWDVEPTFGGDRIAGPVGAPEGGNPAPADVEKAQKPAPRQKSHASSNSNGPDGGPRTRRRSKDADGTSDPVITGNPSEMRSGERGRAASEDKDREAAEERVPGKGGRMVPAETPVNMTFTVTAKERYLWTLELKRRGLTAVGVLRETMEGMVRENDRRREGSGGSGRARPTP